MRRADCIARATRVTAAFEPEVRPLRWSGLPKSQQLPETQTTLPRCRRSGTSPVSRQGTGCRLLMIREAALARQLHEGWRMKITTLTARLLYSLVFLAAAPAHFLPATIAYASSQGVP